MGKNDSFGDDDFENMFDDMNLSGFDDEPNSNDTFGDDSQFSSGDNSFNDDVFGDSNFANEEASDVTVSQNNMFGNLNTVENKVDKKKTYIIIGIAVAALVVLISAAILIGKNSKTSEEPVNTNNTTVNSNVDNIMSTQPKESSTNNTVTEKIVVNSTTDPLFKWTEISESENIVYDADYTELTFTITDIKHYARSVDVNNNLNVKTTLVGSISGLSGTYTLDVPYEKGRLLQIGNQFTVNVKMAEYKGKRVVDEIKY